MQLPSGTILFKQGDRPDGLYLVKSGSIGFFRHGNALEPFAALCAGQSIGMLAVVDPEWKVPDGVHCSATCDTQLCVLSKDALSRIAARHPKVVPTPQ